MKNSLYHLVSVATFLLIFFGCSKDENNETNDNVQPEIVELFINGEDPTRRYKAFKITDKDTIQLGNTATANAQGNATITFSIDLLSTSPTGKSSSQTVDLIQAINSYDEIVYQFRDVSIVNNPTTSSPSISISETSHTLIVFTNSLNTFYGGYKDGLLLLAGETDNIGQSQETFYTLDPNNDNPSITLDSLIFDSTTPELGRVEFTDFTIGREREITITHPRVDGSDENGIGSIAFTASLDNSPRENFRAVLTNTQTQEKDSLETTGPQVIFEDIPTGDYTVEIKSLIDDYYANTTQNITVVSGNANGSQDIKVEGNDAQNITVVVRDFEDTSFVSDYTITTSTGLTETTDAQGTITFQEVPTETSFDMTGSKSGFYTKTTGDYSTPRGEFQGKYILSSQVDTTLNMMAVRKFTYNDGQEVEAEIIMWYRPLRDNTEAIWNTLAIYFPEAAEREIAIQHLTNAANLLGLDLRINADLSQFKGLPSGEQIQGYNPFPGGERYVGEIETNITGYVGTGTATQGKILENGREVSFYTSIFNLGGTDESRNHHEFTNLLNFPLINGNTTISNGEFYITSRDEVASDNVTIDSSKWDLAIMPFWLEQQRYHYTRTDDEGRLLEFSIPKRFEE